MIDRQKIFEFLPGYKHNSGIFINNFFRGRDYKTYCEDKFHAFDFNIGAIDQNVFGDLDFSLNCVNFLSKLEKQKVAYWPIDTNYIDKLIAVADAFDKFKTQDDMIVYRGCTNLERNGVTGLVSVTGDFKIAEQFSRGTILKIHLPRGTKNIDIAKIRPHDYKKKILEDELLISPCDWQIINQKEEFKGREPNNHGLYVQRIELAVKQKDLLSEFLKVMKNPPIEYLPVKEAQEGRYSMALKYLEDYIYNRENGKKPLVQTKVNITNEDLYKLASNNIGAYCALTDIYLIPDGKAAIAKLIENGIKGEEIYLMYNDKFRKNSQAMVNFLLDNCKCK